MRVFWWQAGVHIEPENKEEMAALAILYDGFQKTQLSEATVPEQGFHGVVGNLELHPSGIAPDLVD